MPSPEDLVLGGDVAVRDFGGPGSPVLLLHGAGANLVSMQVLAGELSQRFRAIAVDLHGHGRSGDGPWEWEAILGDLEAVCGELSLSEPYRRGFEGLLTKASAANPRLRVVRVEGATHAMVAERPGEIAQLITRFAAC